MRRALRALLKRPDEILLVALENRRIVGTNHVLIFKHLARALKPAAIIENMVVDANARGAGVGDQLMDAALKIARRRGCYKLSLTSNRKRLIDFTKNSACSVRTTASRCTLTHSATGISHLQSTAALQPRPPQITSQQGTRQNHWPAAQRTRAALPTAGAQSKAPAHAVPAA